MSDGGFVKAVRTIVVDDEPLARSRLRKLLSGRDDLELIAECRNGAEAVAAIRRQRPDLVFLDVQMPDMDGFEVLAHTDAQERPVVVFVTAFDRYAVRAFDVHAMDYLLKPFDNNRFAEAVEIALEHLQLRTRSVFQSRLSDMMRARTVSVKKKGARIPVRLLEVSHVRSAGNYVTLYRNGEEILYRATMSAVAADLDPAHFLRIHRSTIVNVGFVKALRYLNNSQYRFVLSDGTQLTSGRSYKRQVADYVTRTVR